MSNEATKKVDLGKGRYAVFFQELHHGTQRRVNEIIRPFIKGSDGGAVPTMVVKEDGKFNIRGGTVVEISMDKLNWTAINDVILLGQIKEWSFGPVDQETIDGLSEVTIERLVNEANTIYGEQGPLPRGGGGN